METMQYFSDKERGSRSRTEDIVSPTAWGGIVALINTLVSKGAFGHEFPDLCPDPGAGSVGTIEGQFSLAIQADIPGLSWPLSTSSAPDTLTVLDLVQFCYRFVAKPVGRSFHEHFKHYHLSYNVEKGREEFCNRVNTIFSRRTRVLCCV
jgi:hypothetical protein